MLIDRSFQDESSGTDFLSASASSNAGGASKNGQKILGLVDKPHTFDWSVRSQMRAFWQLAKQNKADRHKRGSSLIHHEIKAKLFIERHQTNR